MKELVKETYLTIYHDEQQQWIYANWTGDQNYLTVREGCLQMLEIVKQTGVNKVLNDNREVTSSWSDAANWGGKVWVPAMADAGVRWFAWVYSPFVFSRLSTDTFISYTDAEMVIKTFDDIKDAEFWLLAQKASDL